MKTISFDEAIYKLVPVDPATQMAIGFAYADAARVPFNHIGYDAMLAAVPADLPGVVVHSGKATCYVRTDVESGGIDWSEDCLSHDPIDTEDGDGFASTSLFTHPPAQPDTAASELWARIYRLESEAKGPDGFATWKDAAVDERLKRVAAEREIRELEEPLASEKMPGKNSRSMLPLLEEIIAGDRRIACLESQLAAQAGQEPVAYLVKWADIGNGESESLFYDADAKKHMESAVSYGATIPRSATVNSLYAAPPAPANSLAIVQAALESAANICDSHAGGCSNYADRCAKDIHAINPQTIIDGMQK